MKFKKKYRAGGKTEKPMVYAQETTQVPSTTVDPAIDPTRANPYAGMRAGERQYQYSLDQYQKENPGRRLASYANLFSESLPNITFVNEDFDAVKEFATKQGKDPNDFPFGINTGVFSDPSLKRFDRIGKSAGFEQYANLFNRVTGRELGSENRMTSDSIQSLYNNPNELYNTFKNMNTKGKRGRDEWIGENSGFDFDENLLQKTNRETGKKENVPGFTYRFSDEERSRGNPLFNDTRLTNLYEKVSTGRLSFDMNGNLVGFTRDGDTSSFNELSDTERKSLELYVKNKGLQTIVTQGKTGQELGQFADPGINIPSVGLESVGTVTPTQGMTNLMPTFIDKDDQVGGDIKQIDLEESKQIMSGNVPSGTDDPPPPPSDDTDKEGDTDKEPKAPEDKETEKKEEVVEEKFTIGGKEYESEEEAKRMLEKEPQGQLSDEEYDFVYGYKPQAGKKGMKVPGYKKGGIQLKKKKRKGYGN